jgi:hypothetical protein
MSPIKKQTPLTDEELVRLREILNVSEVLTQDAEYRMARRLVLATWKRTVIALGTIVAALVLLKEQARMLWNWLIGG